MPPRGFKCTVEVSIESVSSAGTWLPNRDELYLTVEVFGQAKRTRLVDPVFPLCLHERFVFEKNFWPAADPQEVLEMLDELPVSIELRQVTDVYMGGCLLAYFDAGAREFLYPMGGSPASLRSGCAVHRGSRQAQMVRTVDFIGQGGPKFEFSTRAAIEQMTPDAAAGCGGGPYADYDFEDVYSDDDYDALEPPPPSGLLRRRRRGCRRPGYGRQTLAAVLRSRSPSPYAVAAAATALRDDYGQQRRRRSPSPGGRLRRRAPPAQPTAPVRVDGRPPFVVRHVDKGLVGRKPVLHDTLTRLGGPHGPLKVPASSRLRRSLSAVDLHQSSDLGGGMYGGARAGRDYGEEFGESLVDYRAPPLYVSGRQESPSGEFWRRRFRDESPLPHRLYSPYHRRGGDDLDFDDDFDQLAGVERGLRRVRIRDSYVY